MPMRSGDTASTAYYHIALAATGATFCEVMLGKVRTQVHPGKKAGYVPMPSKARYM